FTFSFRRETDSHNLNSEPSLIKGKTRIQHIKNILVSKFVMPEFNGDGVNGHDQEETATVANGNGVNLESDSTASKSASLKSAAAAINGHSATSNGGDSETAVAVAKDANAEDEDSASKEKEFQFSVSFVPPSGESFSMHVSSQELVQEIHQILTDREDCCHRTCFSLSLAGKQLDNFVELKNVPELAEGCSIRIVEEMYNVKEAKSHLRHIQDILRSTEPIDAYLGREQMSLSFVNAVTQNSLLSPRPPGSVTSIGGIGGGNGSDKSRQDKNGGGNSGGANSSGANSSSGGGANSGASGGGAKSPFEPPDYALPGSHDLPVMPLHPLSLTGKPPICVSNGGLSFSQWHPPPPNRKLHGDFIYVCFLSLEDKVFHITGSPRGFYLNRCTETVFDPRPSQPLLLFHSLVDLCRHLSNGFKRNWDLLLKVRAAKHPIERAPAPYQVYSWLSPILEQTRDSLAKEEWAGGRLGWEEALPGQTREWNEELQCTKELPAKLLANRVIRERASFKANSDLVAAASRAAVAVLDGHVPAINPVDPPTQRMYIWNNLFLSLGYDVKGHYADIGGDSAALAATSADLRGVRAVRNLDHNQLHCLGTVLVDYRGVRVTVQSIVPGLLDKDQEQAVIHGSVDFGKTIVTDEKFSELLQSLHRVLMSKPHSVLDESDKPRLFHTSVECKGIRGSDGRLYFLDLLRLFPPDVAFLADSKDLPLTPSNEELRLPAPFPLQHPHRLATLRPELLQAFAEARGQLPLFNTDVTLTRLSVRFSSDYSSTELQSDVDLLYEASNFLLAHQIPLLIHELATHSTAPADGPALARAFHSHGVNLRYLGFFINRLQTDLSAQKQQQTPNSPAESAAERASVYLFPLAIQQLLVRSIKHIWRRLMAGVEATNLATAVCHLLNCMFSQAPVPQPALFSDELSRVRRKSKKKASPSASSHGNAYLFDQGLAFVQHNSTSFWGCIIEELTNYYHVSSNFEFVNKSIGSLEEFETACSRSLARLYGLNADEQKLASLSKYSLLRSVCVTLGIQLALREYSFDSTKHLTFREDDIVSLFPVVKCVHPKASDAYQLFHIGQQRISAGQLTEGQELICESLNLLTSVYGPVHSDTASCQRLLGRLSYLLGDYGMALQQQQKAVIISEKVFGIDSAQAAADYAHLGLYAFALGQFDNALALMYRCRYLSVLCHGELHPETPTIDSNIGLMLHAVEDLDRSLQYLTSALRINTLLYGPRSLKSALSHHLIARTHSCKADFRAALQAEKECYTIYRERLGEENERTKESFDCITHLTRQAVVFEKRVRDLQAGKKAGGLCPLQIQTPNLSNLLETLNLVNGIFFIQLSSCDLEKSAPTWPPSPICSSPKAAVAAAADDSSATAAAASAAAVEGEGEDNSAALKQEVLD
uniref:Clu domain-containing protein n=1 Tax=Macrostomum lignano TaxID=282301 RepID=A0A1I8J9G0_9PLAT